MVERKSENIIDKRLTVDREASCRESRTMQIYTASTEPYPAELISRLKMEEQEESPAGFHEIN